MAIIEMAIVATATALLNKGVYALGNQAFAEQSHAVMAM